MKQALRRTRSVATIFAAYAQDAVEYASASQSGREALTDRQLQARLLQTAHSLEKGLSLPAPRSFFGLRALSQLETLIRIYEDRALDPHHVSIQMARGAIRAYFDRFSGEATPPAFARFRDLGSDRWASTAGTLPKGREEQLRAARGDLAEAMKSRHSLRTFGSDPVPEGAIERAVTLAATSPSVCNRQGTRVWVVTDFETKRAALSLQAGNRGFGEGIDTLLVLTSDLGVFRDAGERSQGHVDGGLFAMSLLLALHYEGLAACPLNWSKRPQRSRKLKNVLSLPYSDRVVMMIGVGTMDETFNVAASPRRNVEEILCVVR